MKLRTFVLMAVLSWTFDVNAQTIRVATYNLNWGNRRGDLVLDAIAAADADILCLQETTIQSEGFLRKHLAGRYPEFHAAGHQGQFNAERFVYASRIKLSDVTYHPPTVGLFGFHSAEFHLGHDVVRIVNVHLTPFQLQRGGSLQAALAALGTTESLHTAEMKAVLETVEVRRPTIILGDFNSLSSFTVPKRLTDLGFVDSFASLHDKADSHPTWHWPTRPLPLALRIDYVFHTPHFQATTSEVVRRDGSDHYLLVTELKRSEQGDAENPLPECFPDNKPGRSVRIEDVNWLVGAWQAENNGRHTEEHWIRPKGGMMLGVSRTVLPNGKSTFEFLRIAETSDGLSYFASPRGADTTEFRLREATENRVVFENLDHDYPQRIIYRRTDDTLTGRIEGTMDGREKSSEWSWKAVSASHSPTPP